MSWLFMVHVTVEGFCFHSSTAQLAWLNYTPVQKPNGSSTFPEGGGSTLGKLTLPRNIFGSCLSISGRICSCTISLARSCRLVVSPPRKVVEFQVQFFTYTTTVAGGMGKRKELGQILLGNEIRKSEMRLKVPGKPNKLTLGGR